MDDRVEQLIAQLTQSFKLSDELRANLRRFVSEVMEARELGQAQDIIKRFSAEHENGLAELNELLRASLATAEELRSSVPPAERVRPDTIAKQFGAVIEQIQLDARRPRESDVAPTLKSLDIELKGLIVVEQDEARIVTPSPTQRFDPAQLSTIRMSFGSIPVNRPGTATEPQPTDAVRPSPDSPTLRPEPAAEPKAQPRSSRSRKQ